MLISDRLRFVFIHNPKAAGTSVRRFLARYDDTDGAFWGFARDHALGRRIDKAHLPLADVRASYPDAYAKLASDDYLTFTFVRNPYPRAVSAFKEWANRKGKKVKRWSFARSARLFSRYLEEITPERAAASSDFVHGCPQHLFIDVDGRQAVDRVGRVERFEEDFADVMARLGVEVDGLVHHNRRRVIGEPAGPAAHAPLGAAAPWYGPREVERVNAVYAEDFARFGYVVQDPAAAPERCLGRPPDRL